MSYNDDFNGDFDSMYPAFSGNSDENKKADEPVDTPQRPIKRNNARKTDPPRRPGNNTGKGPLPSNPNRRPGKKNQNWIIAVVVGILVLLVLIVGFSCTSTCSGLKDENEKLNQQISRLKEDQSEYESQISSLQQQIASKDNQIQSYAAASNQSAVSKPASSVPVSSTAPEPQEETEEETEEETTEEETEEETEE